VEAEADRQALQRPKIGHMQPVATTTPVDDQRLTSAHHQDLTACSLGAWSRNQRVEAAPRRIFATDREPEAVFFSEMNFFSKK